MPIRRLPSSLLIIVYILAAVFSLPALLLGLVLRSWADAKLCDRQDRWHAIASFAVLGLLAYGILWWLWHPLDSFAHALLIAFRFQAWLPLASALFLCWLVNTLLAPLVTLLVEGIIHFPRPSLLLKERASFPLDPSMGSATHTDQAAKQDEVELASLPMPVGWYPENDTPLPPSFSTRGSYQDYRAVSPFPIQVHGHALAGHPLGGDLEWIEDGWFVLPEEAMREHGVICGGSGSGKTSFAMRLASLMRAVYHWRVYYLDSKADEGTATQFVTEMERLGTSVRLFPQEPMDGWRGSSSVLRNRLLQLLTYSESYYQDGARLLLGLALDAPGGVPRSSLDFLRRLDQKMLEALYKGTPRATQLKRIPSVHVDGTMLRYESFFTSANTLLDGNWSWEDTQAAYIALDSLGQHDDSQALGRFLIEDFGHFITQRKPKEERVLLILEEFSALAEEVDVTNLFQRIRSAGGSVFVITQGDAGLGSQADKLFQACSNIIVFQGSDPEALLRHAGTRLVPDMSHHRSTPRTNTRETTAAPVKPEGTTLRMREQPKIDANEVRQLNKGEGFFIFKGQVQKVQVEPLHHHAEALNHTLQRLRHLQITAEATSQLSSSSLPIVSPPTPASTTKNNQLASIAQAEDRQKIISSAPSQRVQASSPPPSSGRRDGREMARVAASPDVLSREDAQENPVVPPQEQEAETTEGGNAEEDARPQRKGRGLFEA